MIEVELKAHVRSRAAVLAAVSSFARAEGEVDKSDEYWHGPDWRLHRGSRGFRIRSEGPTADGGGGPSTVVNFKNKRSEGGIEINRECEFEVSDREAFVEFALRLGCESFYSKRKKGRKFRASLSEAEGGGEATIELVEVVGLGDFLEIEILLPDEDPAAVALAQGELRSLLARAGVGEDQIEPRYYSELLMTEGLVPRP
jgi:predicted adenylyl cyclase CyaB